MSDDNGREGGRRPPGVSRRSFIQTVGLSAAAAGSVAADGAADGQEEAPPRGGRILGPGPVEITLRVNSLVQPARTGVH